MSEATENTLSEDVENEIDDEEEDPPDEDLLKILVATDIHLGYNEEDSVRGNDSFETFEEILEYAVKYEVDFILLGGDLFHDTQPSKLCYHRCISLLKRYCLGDEPVRVNFLSDQSRNFPNLRNPIVNYEDPNLNISIPVFSIHGNHDDPTGANRLSAIDILADTGLVNYFGKLTDLTTIQMYPILMAKGETKLTLFGLSHIKDERLSQLFREKKVTMVLPKEGSNWFNMLVLHQNRAPNRGVKNFIPETVLPNFLNLVIWGHEHDCLIDPVKSVNGPYISQPGSSVATSLAVGESLPKYVGLLHVYKKKFKMHKIKLTTVRPFIHRDILVSKPEHVYGENAVEHAHEQINKTIREMIEEGSTQGDKMPLIRLNALFTDESFMTNSLRISQYYADKVANPLDMLSFKLKTTGISRRRDRTNMADLAEIDGDELTERVEQLVEKYFEIKQQHLSVLTISGLCEAVTRHIDRNDTDALNDIFTYQYDKTLERLLKIDDINDENFDEYLAQIREERKENTNEDLEEAVKLLDSEKRKINNPKRSQEICISSDEELSSDANTSAAISRGAAATSRRAAATSRGAAATSRDAAATSRDAAATSRDAAATSRDAAATSSGAAATSRGAPATRPARGRGSRGPRRARAKALY